MELSYLEVGLGSQSIHMEFGDGGMAYTLLVRDSLRCRRFFGLLTGKKETLPNTSKVEHVFCLMYGKTNKRKFYFREHSWGKRNSLTLFSLYPLVTLV